MARTVVESDSFGNSVAQRVKLGIDDALHNRVGGQRLVGGQHRVAVGQEVIEVGVKPGGDLVFERSARVQANTVEQPIGATLIHRSEQIGRLISLARNGRPHWFQDVLTAIEFGVPVAFFGLADAQEKAASQDENLRLPTTVARA